MKTKTTIKSVFGVAALLLAASSMADTINGIDCILEDPGRNCWTDSTGEPNQPSLGELADLVGIDDEGLEILYKDNAENGPESGDFAGSYSTVYSPNEGEASGATITWGGGSFISCPECYLWVKDGNNNPHYYVFDIGWWGGMEELILEGFWPGGGAISNIGIFGFEGGDMQVPEPATLGLLGLAALGLGLTRRRRLAA